MMQVSDLYNYHVNTFHGDNAKKGERIQGARRHIVFGDSETKRVNKPHPYIPPPRESNEPKSTSVRTTTESGDWFDPKKDLFLFIQENIYDAFVAPPQEVLIKRFKGFGIAKFSEHKFEDDWRKGGCIRNG